MSIRMFVDKRNKSPMQHIQLKPVDIAARIHSDTSNEEFQHITHRMAVQIIDMREKALVDAVIACARENGVNDIWLLDKKFVLDALREKMERDRPVRAWTYFDDDHNVSGLLEED